MKEEEKSKETKQIRIRVEKDLLDRLEEESKKYQMSFNGYINFLLNSATVRKETLFEEVINKPEKKEAEKRVYFTKSEEELLKKYVSSNGWSVAKEIRFRTIASLAKKPKLNKEELKAIYSVRSSINILGANLNRLIRNEQVISDHNIVVCKELSDLITELQSKVNWLMKCSNTHFRLKDK